MRGDAAKARFEIAPMRKARGGPFDPLTGCDPDGPQPGPRRFARAPRIADGPRAKGIPQSRLSATMRSLPPAMIRV